jgi:hypothetical protein
MMMNRTTITSVIGLFCLFTAATASAQQPRWGRERQPQTGACFYEDASFRGRYFCVRQGERIQSLPAGLGDKVSSVRVLGPAEVTVFRDTNLRGRSGHFISNVSDLKREGWGDQISSVEVSDARDYRGYGGNARGQGGWRSDRAPVWGRTEPMPRAGACFYEDADFRGMYFCVPRGATYTALPRGFNDRISSVRVFGADVRIFRDQNFRGRSADIRSDTPNLRGSWRDTVSSIRVF